MRQRDFIPQSWTDRAEWSQNFAFNLKTLAPKYGITDSVKTSVADDNNWLQYWTAADPA